MVEYADLYKEVVKTIKGSPLTATNSDKLVMVAEGDITRTKFWVGEKTGEIIITPMLDGEVIITALNSGWKLIIDENFNIDKLMNVLEPLITLEM